MSSPILWGPNSIANNLQGSIINSDLSLNKYNGTANYILNGHAELNTTGWATYANTAQATPVNGTGGSPSVTWTQTTTSPLDGTGSFVFTKDAVNRQGQGASYNFTIDSASQAKVLNITFDYIVGSGTFVAGASGVDSDLEVYIYDVTNSVLIQPTTYKLFSNSSTVAAQFTGTFQTPYNSTSYRLIIHCATTSASAYTVKFDNVAVSPSNYTYGTPITDWVAYTPTFTNLGTVTVAESFWRRAGDSIEVKGRATLGTTVASTASISLPFTVDSNKATIQSVYGGQVANQSQTINYSILTTGGVNVFYLGNIGSSGLSALLGTNVGSSGNIISWHTGTIPILGWSSSVQMSDNTAQNIVAFKAATNVNNAATASNPIISSSVDYDTTGSYNTSTGRYTCPLPGYYQIMVYINNNANNVVSLWKNGSSYSQFIYTGAAGAAGGSITIPCVAGDIIDVRPSVTISANNVFQYSITRVSGPQTIGATDTVAASYWLSANFAASTTVPINFDSKEFDYQGSVTTSATAWKFTAPVAGLYNISTIIYVSTGVFSYFIYKNGTVYKFISNELSGAMAPGSVAIRLLAGDYIDLRPSASATITGGSLSGGGTANIQIIKVGNY